MENRLYKRKYEEDLTSDEDDYDEDDYSNHPSPRYIHPQGQINPYRRRAQYIIAYYKQRSILCINRRARERAFIKKYEEDNDSSTTFSNSETSSNAEDGTDYVHNDNEPEENVVLDSSSSVSISSEISPEERTSPASYNAALNRNYINLSNSDSSIYSPTSMSSDKEVPSAVNVIDSTIIIDSDSESSIYNENSEAKCKDEDSSSAGEKSLTSPTNDSMFIKEDQRGENVPMEIDDGRKNNMNENHVNNDSDESNNFDSVQVVENSRKLLGQTVDEEFKINKGTIDKENNINSNNVTNKNTYSEERNLMKPFNYVPESKLKNLYVAGRLQMDAGESYDFDLAEYDFNKDLHKQLNYWGRNKGFYSSIKDYIFEWHISNGRSHIDEEVLAMMKEIDFIRTYLDKLHQRSDELNFLLNSKEQLCIKSLELKKDVSMNKQNLEEQQQKEIALNDTKQNGCNTLIQTILKRSNMTKEELYQERNNANEMHDLLAAYKFLLPRRNENENNNDSLEQDKSEVFHYNIDSNGEFSLVKSGIEPETNAIKYDIAVKRLKIVEKFVQNSAKMDCNHSGGIKKAVDCIHCLHSWFCALNQQVEEWNGFSLKL